MFYDQANNRNVSKSFIHMMMDMDDWFTYILWNLRFVDDVTAAGDFSKFEVKFKASAVCFILISSPGKTEYNTSCTVNSRRVGK